MTAGQDLPSFMSFEACQPNTQTSANAPHQEAAEDGHHRGSYVHFLARVHIACISQCLSFLRALHDSVHKVHYNNSSEEMSCLVLLSTHKLLNCTRLKYHVHGTPNYTAHFAVLDKNCLDTTHCVNRCRAKQSAMELPTTNGLT